MSIADHLIRPHTTAASPVADARATCECVGLLDVPVEVWRTLAANAADANAFYSPDWARALARHAPDHGGARALLAWDGPMRRCLIGMMPVISAWQAYRLPIPVFVAWQPYAPLTTPLLARDATDEAARGLVAAASKAGAFGVCLPFSQPESLSIAALRRVSAPFGKSWSFGRHSRARLDARQEPDAAMAAISTGKRKELRRQMHRWQEQGELQFNLVANADALDEFLALEAASWKGARGTALAQDAGHSAFIRDALGAMFKSGTAQVATLTQNGKTAAAGVVVRQGSRAFFFKIAHDESAAKFSPGAQLTLALTRALCADTEIDDVDSLATERHPMIDGLWTSRLAIADTFVPGRRDFAAQTAIKAAILGRHALRDAAKRLLRR